jgi:hypothetical protein
MSLSAPGAVRRTEDESRRYVRKLLTDALRSALEAASGAPSDPAALVIERGWLPGGLPVPDDGGLIRHRNFPEQDWQELGLSRAANGNYYDAASQTIWSPDPDGRGFVGRKTNGKDDVAEFTNEPDKETAPLKPQTAPEGFVIENPAEKTTDIFVENMPDVPAGKQLIVSVTGADGTITAIPLTQSIAGEIPGIGPLATNMGVLDSAVSGHAMILSSTRTATLGSASLVTGTSPAATGNTAYFNPTNNSAFSSNIVGYLQGGSLMVTFPSDSIPAAVQLAIGDIVPAGQAPQIIVKSGP